MEISGLEILPRGNQVRAQVRLASVGGSETLWYDVDEKYGRFMPGARLDAFVVGALLVAMERGERELVARGPMSERLLHNLQQVIPIWRLATPGRSAVAIRPDAVLPKGEVNEGAVVTGFSGGIDSFSTLADYLDPPNLPGYRLTHLLFCNVGNHGEGEGGRRTFSDRWGIIKDYASSVGLDFVRVDSNLGDLLTRPFTASHVARNTSAVLLLQALFARYLFSSSFSFRDSHFGETEDVSHTDPAAVHLLSTESLECISTGCQRSRVEKTKKAITVPGIRQTLNVCNHPSAGAKNCSKCYKCLRTLASLDLLGVLDEFDTLFDLAAYRRRRFEYLALLPARTDDPFIREIYEFSRTSDARLPVGAQLVHRLWPALSPLAKIARGTTRRLAGSS